MISKYFDKVKNEINSYSHVVENYRLNEKVYSEVLGFIEGELFFPDESRLAFAEVKDIEQPSKIKYHYHYMNKNDETIFRYDNAKHHTEIMTFPHHKHLPDGIVESSEPEINLILIEIEAIILKNKEL